MRQGWTRAAGIGLAAVLLGVSAPPATARPTAGGDERWVARYRNGNGWDAADTVATSPDGSTVFVTGSSVGTNVYDDYATIAYDASTGAARWVRRYNGPDDYFDDAASMAVSPDGTKVFVTGWSPGVHAYRDFVTIAYDASTGAGLWFRRYSGPAAYDDTASAITPSPDGSMVFVTGASHGSFNASDYTTIAYDASTGRVVWAGRYRGPANGLDTPLSIAAGPDGSKVFVTGYGYWTLTSADYSTVAYDARTGAVLWTRRYDGTGGDDFASSIGTSPDGSAVFVTGLSAGSDTASDYATIAYDASSGAVLWARRYNGPANGDDSAAALAASPDGSAVFVTGSSTGSTSSSDYLTIAYDASSGALRWARRFNGPGNGDDRAAALGLGAGGGEVFVTGSSLGVLSSFDYATVAYDGPSGAVLWTRQYDGPGSDYDYATSVTASPDGSAVYVTGSSPGSGGVNDYATVAYEP